MPRKHALIVDDSKTARQILAKKLAAYEIDVVTADSAANAIDYLYGNTPDAVFMDYEMPGMDGFQALKIIKSNPKTATIPVMMYTSKEGGIALSQARALGAIGVLPKQMEAHGLDAIIEQLHLHPHQQSLVETFHDESEPYQTKPKPPEEPSPPSNVEYLNQQRVRNEKVEYPEEVVDESVFVLKRQTRIYLKELLSAENRVTEKLSGEINVFREELDRITGLQEALVKRVKTKRVGLYLLIVLVLVMLVYLAWQQRIMQHAQKNVGGLNEIKGDVSQLQEQMNHLATLMSQTPVEGQAEPPEVQKNLEFLSWAANRGTEFEYGENPYNDLRVAWLSELVTQLHKAGFTGVVSLNAHFGNFCLTKSETGVLKLAKDDANFQDCIFSADSREGGFTQTSYQTLGFANYLNSIASNKDVPIEVVIESDEYSDPAIPYPDAYGVNTAGTWNKVALRNQKIEVSLFPVVTF